MYHYGSQSMYWLDLQDCGKQTYVVNIEDAMKKNNTFRTALWTGDHLQVTLMSISLGEDNGLEVHPTTDQFLRVEEGQGVVQIGDTENNLDFRAHQYSFWWAFTCVI